MHSSSLIEIKQEVINRLLSMKPSLPIFVILQEGHTVENLEKMLPAISERITQFGKFQVTHHSSYRTQTTTMHPIRNSKVIVTLHLSAVHHGRKFEEMPASSFMIVYGTESQIQYSLTQQSNQKDCLVYKLESTKDLIRKKMKNIF